MLAVTAALAAAGGPPASAQADSLSPGQAVTPPGTVVNDFSVATSPAGGRVALLYNANAGGNPGQQLLFARLGLGRNLGPVRRLEDRRSDHGRRRVTIFSSRVAVSSDNTAVAAWPGAISCAWRSHRAAAASGAPRRWRGCAAVGATSPTSRSRVSLRGRTGAWSSPGRSTAQASRRCTPPSARAATASARRSGSGPSGSPRRHRRRWRSHPQARS
jgi:hypothetical protein